MGGTLSAVVTKGAPVSVGFTGQGTLSGTVYQYAALAAALSGTGNLAAQVMPRVPVSAALSGSGALSGLAKILFTPYNEISTAQTNAPVPPGCGGCYVTLIGGGGPGGNGGGGGNPYSGGGGGGGAKIARGFIPVASLGSTYSVQVGASGTASTFSSGSITLTANNGGFGSEGGAGGSGGTATQAGISGFTLLNGTAGGTGLNAAGAGAPGVANANGAGAGGGGGASGNNTGGKGGDSATVTGGAGGAGATTGTAGTGASPAAAAAGAGGAGAGGGGGVSTTSGTMGNGGVGGSYGGGGGGGGCYSSTGNTHSQPGGTGAPGYTLIEWVAPIPAYDSVGPGAQCNNATSCQWTHTPVASSGLDMYVLTGGYNYGATDQPTSVTYGGQAMTKLGDSTGASGFVYGPASIWRLDASLVPAGPQTVIASQAGGQTYVATSVAVKNVNSYSATQAVAGTSSTAPSQTVSTGTLVLQCFGFEYVPSASRPLTPSGGTNIFNTMGTQYGGLIVSYGPNPTTFGANSSGGYYWSGIAVALS
jgi:hypothetical protein